MNVETMSEMARERALHSAMAVKAMCEYAKKGGHACGAKMPDNATVKDFDLFLQHMKLWLAEAMMLASGIRPNQTRSAVSVAVCGGNTHNDNVVCGKFKGGLDFGEYLGSGADVLLNWSAIVERIRLKDAQAISGKGVHPLGITGQTTHAATKNNRHIKGACSCECVLKPQGVSQHSLSAPPRRLLAFSF